MSEIQSALVRSILERWRAYEWTVQGFGFVRVKIQDVGRVHVWDSRLAMQLVSTVHTHPWRLHSTIISGELINQRFLLPLDGETSLAGLPYSRSRIKTGEGGGLVGEPEATRLVSSSLELYVAGQSYEQEPEEIHRTIAQDGTVTLLERQQGEPLEEALVFWPCGIEWVSAEPKPVDPWLLERAVSHALARWTA
jgi:hypothetical protein